MATRVNLPSELRVKSVDTTASLANTFENTDVVVDTTAGKIFESNGSAWTKILDSKSIKTVSNPNITDFDLGDVVFDSNDDSIKYKSTSSATAWTRIQNKNHIQSIDVATADPEEFEAGDIVITPFGDIYKVTGAANSRAFVAVHLKAAIQLEDDSSVADIAPYSADDVILTSDLKLLKKEFSSSTEWDLLVDLGKVEHVPAKFSVVGPRAGTDGNSNVAVGDRLLFEHSRGINHFNSAGATPIDELVSLKEIHVIDADTSIVWNTGRGLDVVRFQDVVGRSIFPEAEIYNRTKDTARSVTFYTFQVSTFQFAYEDSNNRYVKTSDYMGIFSRKVVVAPDDGGAAYTDQGLPIVRQSNGTFKLADYKTNATLYLSQADADAQTNAQLSENFILVDETTKQLVATADDAEDRNANVIDDTFLSNNKVPLPIIARLDIDDGSSALQNSFTVGYRQKAKIYTMDSDEVDRWGFSIASDDESSEFDHNSVVFLVSVESI